MRQVIKHRDIRLLKMIRRTDPVILCRGLFCVVFCNFACVKALCPVPLMQNYMIKSVKMTKKSIFRDHFSWKVRTFALEIVLNIISHDNR